MITNNLVRWIFFSSVTFLTLIIFILFYQYDSALKKAYINIEHIERINVKAFANNIEYFLRNECKECMQNPLNIEKQAREKMDNILSMFTGEQYAYVFLVVYDKEKYRYIFDGAKNIEDKGQYLQKFDPSSKFWDEVLITNKPKWITQSTINGLWLTYLHPIVENNKTRLILAFDFSAKEYSLVKEIFLPINNYLLLIAVALGLFLCLIYFFGYLFYKQRKKTFIDSLTGLHNRHYLQNISNKIKLNDICIALIDIDHFKRVNDTLGHDAGDEVLKEFANRLKNIITDDDVLIRYGGEEFLLFLSKQNLDKNDEIKMIEDIQKKISSKKFNTKEDNLKVTSSIGFNSTPHLSRSLDGAISIADKMLYAAKVNGRNRVEIYEEKRADEDNVFGSREVLKALKEKRLVAYYQPIMDTKTKKIARYEMLVRIISKTGKVIFPYKFLPNIRSNSSYRYMSKYMLEKAIQTIKKDKVAVSLNFDVRDFLNETLYEQMYDILSENKNISSYLSIELLENEQITDFNIIKKQIKKIQSLGVKIAIDDFGSGYSTFNYILSLKPDVLKLDGCLIHDICSSDKSQLVVRSIISLCQQLNIKIVAEFVDSEEKIIKLTEMGVDFVQGYAIGKANDTLEIVVEK